MKAFTCKHKGLCLSSKQHPVKRNPLRMRVYSCILKTCFGSLIGALGFAQFTITEKQNTIFVQKSNFIRMRSN